MSKKQITETIAVTVLVEIRYGEGTRHLAIADTNRTLTRNHLGYYDSAEWFTAIHQDGIYSMRRSKAVEVKRTKRRIGKRGAR